MLICENAHQSIDGIFGVFWVGVLLGKKKERQVDDDGT